MLAIDKETPSSEALYASSQPLGHDPIFFDRNGERAAPSVASEAELPFNRYSDSLFLSS